MSGGRRRSRKMRGGNGYGASLTQDIGVGAFRYDANMSSSPGGVPVVGPPTTGVTAMGGRRRSRKGKNRRTRRKSKGRRRSMRGGGSPSSVGYSFGGDGQSGLANHSAYNANAAPSGAFAIPQGTR
jgi:hypothetical protein